MDIMKMHCIHIQNFQKKQKKIETKQNIGLQVLGFNMDKIKLKAVLSVTTMIEKGLHSFNICFLLLLHTLMPKVCKLFPTSSQPKSV